MQRDGRSQLESCGRMIAPVQVAYLLHEKRLHLFLCKFRVLLCTVCVYATCCPSIQAHFENGGCLSDNPETQGRTQKVRIVQKHISYLKCILLYRERSVYSEAEVPQDSLG